MKSKFLIIFVLVFATQFTFGQTTRKFIDTGSISTQADYLISKSTKYENFKVIRTSWITQLIQNVNDSISDNKQKLFASNNEINIQKKTIDSLKLAINNSEKTIENLTNKDESILIFGNKIDKSLFKTTVFFVILFLIVVFVMVLIKYKKNAEITSKAKNELEELEQEYDSHRKKALEREQGVRRQLQDLIMKNKKSS